MKGRTVACAISACGWAPGSSSQKNKSSSRFAPPSLYFWDSNERKPLAEARDRRDPPTSGSDEPRLLRRTGVRDRTAGIPEGWNMLPAQEEFRYTRCGGRVGICLRTHHPLHSGGDGSRCRTAAGPDPGGGSERVFGGSDVFRYCAEAREGEGGDDPPIARGAERCGEGRAGTLLRGRGVGGPDLCFVGYFECEATRGEGRVGGSLPGWGEEEGWGGH